MSDTFLTIGEKIKYCRKKLNMTQKELGEICGIAESTIRRYELNKLRPKYETLLKISSALNIDARYFYKNDIDFSKDIFDTFELNVDDYIPFDYNDVPDITKMLNDLKCTFDINPNNDRLIENTLIQITELIEVWFHDEYSKDYCIVFDKHNENDSITLGQKRIYLYEFMKIFNKLNNVGKKEAFKRIKELAQLEKYTKTDNKKSV